MIKSAVSLGKLSAQFDGTAIAKAMLEPRSRKVEEIIIQSNPRLENRSGARTTRKPDRNNNKNMKNQLRTAGKTILMTVMVAVVLGASLFTLPTTVEASGGSGSGGGGGGSTTGTDTIKVSKCYYFDTGSYVELLINASSSNSSAHLYAHLPDGTYLGEVQNGGGGRYGGTVFVTLYIPATITIISSSGGSITVPCVPGQI